MAKFAGTAQLNNHFQSHGADFGAANANEYEVLAEQFLTSPLAAPILEHTRLLGDLVRFNPATDDFGTMRGGVIRTFFKPVPCATLPLIQRAVARAAKKCHDYATNMLYYQGTCALW
jgi:pyocin large subunit-like protein